MQPDRTLNLKCPACGELKARSLDEIKAQQYFECECGFYADLTPKTLTKDQPQRPAKKVVPA